LVKRKNFDGMRTYQVGTSLKEHKKAERIVNWYRGFINEDKRQTQKDFRHKIRITPATKRDGFVAMINDVLKWKLGEESEFEEDSKKILKAMEEKEELKKTEQEKEPKQKPKSEPGPHNI